MAAPPDSGGTGPPSHPPARPRLSALLVNLRRVLRNWYWLAPLSFVVLPSRCFPRAGLIDHKIAHMPITLRLRNGMELECLLSEFPGFVDTFALMEYDVPGLDWASVRTVVDVGANVGAATLWFCVRAPDTRVIAVEPGAAAGERCGRNMKRNGLGDRVQVRHAALGATSGRAYFHPGPASVNATVSTSPTSDLDREVEVLTLSDLLADHGVDFADVLKLDCEGAEHDVLLTASTSVLAMVGAIVGEYHGPGGQLPAHLRRHLEGAGFVVRQRRNVSQVLFVATRPSHGPGVEA